MIQLIKFIFTRLFKGVYGNNLST